MVRLERRSILFRQNPTKAQLFGPQLCEPEAARRGASKSVYLGSLE
jgi:hypothetical protein